MFTMGCNGIILLVLCLPKPLGFHMSFENSHMIIIRSEYSPCQRHWGFPSYNNALISSTTPLHVGMSMPHWAPITLLPHQSICYKLHLAWPAFFFIQVCTVTSALIFLFCSFENLSMVQPQHHIDLPSHTTPSEPCVSLKGPNCVFS